MAANNYYARAFMMLKEHGIETAAYSVSSIRKVRNKDLFDIVLSFSDETYPDALAELEAIFKSNASITTEVEWEHSYESAYPSAVMKIDLPGSTLAPWREDL